jgi:hypothetical protein
MKPGWWAWSRCDHASPRPAGGTTSAKPGFTRPVAPLCAARRLAARAVPPLMRLPCSLSPFRACRRNKTPSLSGRRGERELGRKGAGGKGSRAPLGRGSKEICADEQNSSQIVVTNEHSAAKPQPRSATVLKAGVCCGWSSTQPRSHSLSFERELADCSTNSREAA